MKISVYRCTQIFFPKFVLPNETDGCLNASKECASECWLFFSRNVFRPFMFSDPSSHVLQLCLTEYRCLGLQLLMSTVINEWHRWLTIKVFLASCVLSLLQQRCEMIGTLWRKLVTSTLWFSVAALTLTAWLPSSIWLSVLGVATACAFVMESSTAISLQCLIACFLLKQTVRPPCYISIKTYVFKQWAIPNFIGTIN